jgi:hypothetical protein
MTTLPDTHPNPDKKWLHQAYTRLDDAIDQALASHQYRSRHAFLVSLAEATHLRFDWIVKFADREIHDPGSLKVQTLLEYLISQDAGARQ